MNGRLRRVLIILASIIAGLALYYWFSRNFFAVSARDIAVVLSSMSIPMLMISIGTRATIPMLQALELYLACLALRKRLGIRSMYIGVSAALGMEYVVPLGGMTEVYKIWFLTRNGVDLVTAIKAVVLQRLAISLSMFVDILFILSIEIPMTITITLSLITLGMAAMNALLLGMVRIKRFAKLADSMRKAISAKIERYIGIKPPSIGMALEELKTNYIWFAFAVAVAIAERLVTALSGYIVAKGLRLELSFVQAVLIFDFIQVVMWLLPIVTPGNVGIFESLQLMVFKAIGSPSLAVLVPLIYRVVTVIATVPQFVIAMLSDMWKYIRLPRQT